MEHNTVVLSLDEYNELRDFKENIESSKTLMISKSLFGLYKKYITKEETFNNLIKDNNELTEKYLKLVKDFDEYKDSVNFSEKFYKFIDKYQYIIFLFVITNIFTGIIVYLLN